jgi:hypothetical protein
MFSTRFVPATVPRNKAIKAPLKTPAVVFSVGIETNAKIFEVVDCGVIDAVSPVVT